MATYPLHYKLLYPSVDDDTIAGRVVGRLEWLEEHSVNLVPHSNPIL